MKTGFVPPSFGCERGCLEYALVGYVGLLLLSDNSLCHVSLIRLFLFATCSCGEKNFVETESSLVLRFFVSHMFTNSFSLDSLWKLCYGLYVEKNPFSFDWLEVPGFFCWFEDGANVGLSGVVKTTQEVYIS